MNRFRMFVVGVLVALVAPPAVAAPDTVRTPAERGIATLESIPTAADVRALRSHGLTVQPMRRLPLALVRGSVEAMRRAVAAGAALDIYPDEPIELHDQESSDAIMAAAVRAKGLTGKGITVAIVDSGCDASHPDLADHVTHNVKLYSAEYANVKPDGTNTIAVAIEEGPYRNTDLGSGHGTHVAGIVAADGTADPSHLGVAPDAELVCFSIGEVLFTTTVVTAYDYLLDQPDLWGVDVINNSWGNSFQQFDPRHPVAVATRSVAALGVVVVFSAGNSGYSDAEMSVNPFSQAPWVTAVANGDLERHRADSSSSGLHFDNSRPVALGRGRHTVHLGNRIGQYHPDVTAPGTSISSSCDSAGTVVGPCPPGENAEASGTSMASPHVAGAAAVLLQANPRLTPAQVRWALHATARPVMGYETDDRAPFWQAGWGWVDLERAVRLVQRRDYSRAIIRARDAANRRVLSSIPFEVPRSDWWVWDAPRASVDPVADVRTFNVTVPLGITHLKVTLNHPSLSVVGENQMTWEAEVFDSTGKSLGVTTEAPTGAGTASVLVDLKAAGAKYGELTLVTTGVFAVSDPDTFDSESLLGRLVTLQVAQLRPNA